MAAQNYSNRCFCSKKKFKMFFSTKKYTPLYSPHSDFSYSNTHTLIFLLATHTHAQVCGATTAACTVDWQWNEFLNNLCIGPGPVAKDDYFVDATGTLTITSTHGYALPEEASVLPQTTGNAVTVSNNIEDTSHLSTYHSDAQSAHTPAIMTGESHNNVNIGDLVGSTDCVLTPEGIGAAGGKFMFDFIIAELSTDCVELDLRIYAGILEKINLFCDVVDIAVDTPTNLDTSRDIVNMVVFFFSFSEVLPLPVQADKLVLCKFFYTKCAPYKRIANFNSGHYTNTHNTFVANLTCLHTWAYTTAAFCDHVGYLLK